MNWTAGKRRASLVLCAVLLAGCAGGPAVLDGAKEEPMAGLKMNKSNPEKVEFGTYKNAMENKQKLLSFLRSVYGNYIISGQMDNAWSDAIDMAARVFGDTGKYPALMGYDFMNIRYPDRDGGGKKQTDEALAWWLTPPLEGTHGLVTFCWHWRMPRDGLVRGDDDEFYTEKTEFRIPYKDGALDTSDPRWQLIVEDLNLAALELQKFKMRGIPVLWRPFHEASGGWFWWGASGSEPYKALWDFMFRYFTEEKGLNNLIWVWNGQDAAWYPGAATVDIAGSDVYPSARDYGSQIAKFKETQGMAPGRIVAMTENGEIPDPGALQRDKALWSWFMTWNDAGTPDESIDGNFWAGEAHNTLEHRKAVYASPYVLTLENLPDITQFEIAAVAVTPQTPRGDWPPVGRLGWNLGNSFDAHVNGASGETLWGNPKATKALFEGIAAQGFTSVRIPVTWMGHFGRAPDYTIEKAWLARIAEVAGWVRDAGMSAIINMHHDGSDSKYWLNINKAAASAEGLREVDAIYTSLWKQIADYFKDEGPYLIFEAFNELHDGTWGDGNQKLYGIVNHWDQLFVDTVRATGGRNADRWLVVAGYVTRPSLTMRYLKIPEDSAKNRLIVSVHMYDPYEFAIRDSVHTWGNEATRKGSQETYINNLFKSLYTKYIEQGIPLIIDEYGAVIRGNPANEKYRVYYLGYVTAEAYKYGIVPYYWDNGDTDGGEESFGMFNRRTGDVFPESRDALEAMKKSVN